LKIGSSIDKDLQKIIDIKAMVPQDTILYVDANQTLDFDDAIQWMAALSKLGIVWLEEPFAPDNVKLFERLVQAKKNHGWSCDIVTGENCPNHYTAAALIESGIDRFQPDPCRMFGLLDTILTSCIAKIENCQIAPHAGGSSLDEQSPHIQLFNLARVQTELDPADSLTENVGFCSKYFISPTTVKNGVAQTPRTPGLLAGLSPEITSNIIDYKKGITWLEL
jgi:L-fuconate dehydratase